MFGYQNIKLFLFSALKYIWGGVLTLSSFCLLSSSIPALAVQKIGTTTFSKLILSSLAFFLTLQKKIQKYLVSMMHQKHYMTFWYTVILSILFSCRFGKSQCQKQFKDPLFYIISTNRINKVEYVLVITHVKTINALESVLVEVIRLTFNLVNDLDLNHLSK